MTFCTLFYKPPYDHTGFELGSGPGPSALGAAGQDSSGLVRMVAQRGKKNSELCNNNKHPENHK